MKKNWLYFMIFLVACNNENPSVAKPDTDSLSKAVLNMRDTTNLKNDDEGVLILYTDYQKYDTDRYNLFNTDGTIFNTIYSEEGEVITVKPFTEKILAYYPDYHIAHFNARLKNDSTYLVKVGNEYKQLMKTSTTSYLSWEEYILKFYCVTNNSNPLRDAPNDNAPIQKVLNYTQVHFICIEISGDWVKIKCDSECEGCSVDNPKLSGWIRWKKDGKVILEQRYVC